MPLDRPPYYFLDNTINLLIVDDDAPIRSLLSQIISPVKLYSIKTASTAGEAEPFLASPERVHLCVIDLGLRDIEDDEFYLIRRFSDRVAFIIFTGSSSPTKGFHARECGAKAIIEKSPDFDPENFLHTINHYALLNILNPRYNLTKDTLSAATEALIEHQPKFVSSWAMHMAITDRELRHIWSKNLGANAKIILSIHQLFRSAFDYYEQLADRGIERASFPVDDVATYRRLEEYFHCHKSTIIDFIAFGNVVIKI
ncbi:MAG: response regulator [Chitinivibrionales bacterium]